MPQLVMNSVSIIWRAEHDDTDLKNHITGAYVCADWSLRYGQFEVFCQFFIGRYNKSGGYVDEIKVVARKYLMTPTSFGFDFVTSLPWSYMDIYSYNVSKEKIKTILFKLDCSIFDIWKLSCFSGIAFICSVCHKANPLGRNACMARTSRL